MVNSAHPSLYDGTEGSCEINDAPVTAVPLTVVSSRKTIRAESPFPASVESLIEWLTGKFFVSPVLAPDAQQAQTVQAVTDGRRTASILPDQIELGRRCTVKMPLSFFGIAGDEGAAQQEFVVNVKGVGTDYTGCDEGDEIVFSLNDPGSASSLVGLGPVILPVTLKEDPGDFRPIGGHDLWTAEHSLGKTELLRHTVRGFKFAPTIAVSQMPIAVYRKILGVAETHGIARDWRRMEIAADNGIVINRDNFSLVEEFRLLPSQIRGYHFTSPQFDLDDPACLADAQERFRKIGMDPRQFLLGGVLTYMRDFARMMSVFTDLVQDDVDGVFIHGYFTETNQLTEMDEDAFSHYDLCWYLMKDIVLAQTGAYFVDLESCRFSYVTLPLLERRAARFIPEMLKEWTRLLCHLQLVAFTLVDTETDRASVEQYTFTSLLTALIDEGVCTIRREGDTFFFTLPVYTEERQMAVVVPVQKAMFNLQYTDLSGIPEGEMQEDT